MNYKELFKDSMSLLMEPEVNELLEITNYWRTRCILAENYIKESPSDPDITKAQLSAWMQYQTFLEYQKPIEITTTSLPPTCTKEWESADYCGEKNKCLKCVTKTK